MNLASGIRNLRLRLLATAIRHTVRRNMARATDPAVERLRFLNFVRWFLPDPPGAAFEPDRPGGVPCLWAWVPPERSARTEGRSPGAASAAGLASGVILYLHGGAFVMGSPRTHRALGARLAAAADMRALLPHYRRAPEDPFPAAVEDARAVYAALLERGEAPQRIVLAGDSAGGGLALSLLAEILRLGWPPPAGLVAFSPVVDLTFSGASWQSNRHRDPMLPAERGPDMAAIWLQGVDPRDPRASPLFADWPAPLPPVLLVAGEDELLRDDAVRMAARLRAAGGRVDLRLEAGLPHAWPFLCPWLPEACATIAEAGAFVAEVVRSPDAAAAVDRPRLAEPPCAVR